MPSPLPESDRNDAHPGSDPNAAPRPLDDAALLLLWGRGSHMTGRERTELVLRAAYPNLKNPGSLTLGEANKRLIRLRVANFGPGFHFVDKCPDCGEGVEFSIDADAILQPPKGPTETDDRTHTLEHGEWSVRYRLLRLVDWRDDLAESADTPEAAARRLLEPTLFKATKTGESVALADLPEEVLEALSEAQADADPWAEIEFALNCPKCETAWQSRFDPADYFVRELAASARRILAQIHKIASAYGWTEDTILALSPERRATYLQLIDEYADAAWGDGPATQYRRGGD